MFYSQGIRLEDLGIPTVDGSDIEKDPRKIWKIFCDNYFLFSGTPTKMWLSFVFKDFALISTSLRNLRNSLGS